MMEVLTSRMLRKFARALIGEILCALAQPRAMVGTLSIEDLDREEIIGELRNEVLKLRRLWQEAQRNASPQAAAERNEAIASRDQALAVNAALRRQIDVMDAASAVPARKQPRELRALGLRQAAQARKRAKRRKG